MTAKTFNSATLRQFTGTEHLYRHGLARGILYTDGAKYVAESAGAYWLLDEIAFAQKGRRAVAAEEFQVWKLAVNADGTGRVTSPSLIVAPPQDADREEVPQGQGQNLRLPFRESLNGKWRYRFRDQSGNSLSRSAAANAKISPALSSGMQLVGWFGAVSFVRFFLGG